MIKSFWERASLGATMALLVLTVGLPVSVSAQVALGGPSEGDSQIFFFDGGVFNGQSIFWDDSAVRFRVSADLDVEGDTIFFGSAESWEDGGANTISSNGNALRVEGVLTVTSSVSATGSVSGSSLSTSSSGNVTVGNNIILTDSSDARIDHTAGFDIEVETPQDMEFQIDTADSGGTSFIDWYRFFHDGSYSSSKILAELEEDGDFNIRGIFRANQASFDIAEGFMMAEAVEPGDVVSIVPGNAHSVRLATEADGSTVIGVVSSRPGMVLAGGFFDEGTIADWGPELLAKFHKEQNGLARSILEDVPELGALAAASNRSVAAILDETVALDSEAETNLREKLIDQVMKRFAARHIAPIALAGRVPVTVDASFGPIEVGDLLSPSSIPGIARRADGSGAVIGVALEAQTAGAGQVMMMIHRGHQVGLGGRVARAELGDLRQEVTAQIDKLVDENRALRRRLSEQVDVASVKDAMLAELSKRLETLERTVYTMKADRLAAPRPGGTVSQ